MKEIPKFELPNIQPYTPLHEATKEVINAMIEHYNTYIVAPNNRKKK